MGTIRLKHEDTKPTKQHEDGRRMETAAWLPDEEREALVEVLHREEGARFAQVRILEARGRWMTPVPQTAILVRQAALEPCSEEEWGTAGDGDLRLQISDIRPQTSDGDGDGDLRPQTDAEADGDGVGSGDPTYERA